MSNSIISLSESLDWKLRQLHKKSGMSRSGLIKKAILLLASDMDTICFPGGEIGKEFSFEDIENEYIENQKQKKLRKPEAK